MTGTPPESARGGTERNTFTRELGLTHREFYRSLPAAIAHRPFAVEGHRVVIEQGSGTVIIELGPQLYRSIASLRLPYVEARFTFKGIPRPDRDRFMERFERYFRRGGG